MTTSGDHPVGPLSDLERALVDHVACGQQLDLSGGDAIDQAEMRSWDSSRTIRAAVVRDILRGRLVCDPDPHGLRLRGARIIGRLDLENLTSRVAVRLSHCVLANGLAANDASLPLLGLDACLLEHPTEAPVAADRLAVAGGLSLKWTLVAGACPDGAVSLVGARIGGDLNCAFATLRNDYGAALDADGIQVDGDVSLNAALIVGNTRDGAVRLTDAQVRRLLSCAGTSIHNGSGPALNADRLHVDQSVFLVDEFTATGADADGAVRLISAQIGGQLRCLQARINNGSGPALVADGIRVGRSVILADGFTATGAGRDGALRLPGARIGGQLDCPGMTVQNQSGSAILAVAASVDHDLVLTGFDASGGGDYAAIDLSRMRVGGQFRFAPAHLQNSSQPHALMAVDGLTYGGIPAEIPPDEWLRFLREDTPAYTAQPYQHLAAAHRAAGHERQARQVLIAQRRDQIDRGALTGSAERAWARLTGLTLGYGYQPWRALLSLLVVVAVSLTVTLTVARHGGLSRTDPRPSAPVACPTVDQIGVGLDLGLPLIKTGVSDQCQMAQSAAGHALTITGWIIQLLAWSFATLFIAGFTGAVRKT